MSTVHTMQRSSEPFHLLDSKSPSATASTPSHTRAARASNSGVPSTAIVPDGENVAVATGVWYVSTPFLSMRTRSSGASFASGWRTCTAPFASTTASVPSAYDATLPARGPREPIQRASRYTPTSKYTNATMYVIGLGSTGVTPATISALRWAGSRLASHDKPAAANDPKNIVAPNAYPKRVGISGWTRTCAASR